MIDDETTKRSRVEETNHTKIKRIKVVVWRYTLDGIPLAEAGKAVAYGEPLLDAASRALLLLGLLVR
jgi:hypothetical protein